MSFEVLLSGLLGALLVFALGVAREWWRDERERRGLLLLVRTEIGHNAEVVRTIAERLSEEFPVADLIGSPDFLRLKTSAWDNVQDRAAALLPGELMAALDGYYAPLQTLLTLAGFSGMASDSFDRDLRGMIQEERPDWEVSATRNPYMEQLEQFVHAQEHATAEIERYLNRPWWGTPLLRIDRWARGRGSTHP